MSAKTVENKQPPIILSASEEHTSETDSSPETNTGQQEMRMFRVLSHKRNDEKSVST